MDIYEQVAESPRIEGIDRPPTDEEIAEHRRFMRLEALSIGELEAFLKVYLRVPRHDGHDSGLMADSIPE